MDVNNIKAAIESAASVTEIRTILKSATDNNITLDTQYLKDLMVRQSVQVEGKVGITLFYSGGLQTDGNGSTVPLSSEGYQAWQIAEGIGKNNSQIITIGQTDAYALLDSDEFKIALEKSSPIDFDRILNGITENGIRTELGLWDITSQRIAASAVGDVRTLTPFSLSDKVFAQTELPALLANDKVTSIDGIARTDLLRLVNDKGGIGSANALEAARSAIAAQSWLKALDLEIGTDSTTGKLLVGDSAFFNTNAGITGSELPSDVISRTSISELMGSIHDSQWDWLRQGAENLSRIDALSALEKGVDKLGKLGTAADVLTLILASSDAHAAYEAGDKTGAATIMADWSAKFAAGFAGGAELASLAAPVSAPWSLTGPIGAGTATIFTIAAGITGALLGESAAQFAIDMGRKYDLMISEASSSIESLFNAGHTLDNLIANFFTSAQTVIQRRDPLVFDLDNDGIESTGISTTNTIYFDHTADGIKTATGWVKPDDAFLVLDKNANGVIDNGRELFGDSTLKSNGQLAQDGFDALKDLDSNADGKINSSDAKFASLRLWRDLNQDGVSQSNELFTLGSQNIVAINVASIDHSQILSNGNQLADLGSFIKSDGSSGTLGEVIENLGDINLAQDTFHSQFTDILNTLAVSQLPDIKGSGQVRSLREAATLSPILAQLLSDFAAAGTRNAQQALLNPLLKAWSDTSAMPTTFTGAYAGHSLIVNGLPAVGTPDRQAWEAKISQLEHFNGRTFNPVPGGAATVTLNFWSGNLNLLNQSYNALSHSVYEALVLQTRLKPYLDAISFNVTASGNVLDFSGLDAKLDAHKNLDQANALIDLIELNQYSSSIIKMGWNGMSKMRSLIEEASVNPAIQQLLMEMKVQYGSGTLTGTTAQDVLLGKNGNDNLTSGDGNDLLSGGQGNDTLSGGIGNDWLDGGAGNDQLIGGFGNDTYLFGKSDGQDTISNDYDVATGKLNVLQFRAGVVPDEIAITRSNNDLVLAITGTPDKVTVGYFFYSDDPANASNAIQQVRFSDGTSWDSTALIAKLFAGTAAADSISGTVNADTISGAAGADYLYGRNGDDVLNGGADNDYISGDNGNDTLDGGAGNDWLTGGAGNDTYLFGIGDGQDMISSEYDVTTGKLNVLQFRAGVAPDEIVITRSSNNLVLAIAGTPDKVTVGYFFYNDDPANAYNAIQQVRFSDGTSWDSTALIAKLFAGTAAADSISGTVNADTINGAAGADYLFGRNGDDVLNGGADNDYVSGDNGNDTLDGGAGNDQLIGGAGNDTYLFGRGSALDVVSDYDPTVGNIDMLNVGSDVANNQLWFRRAGSDLEVSIIGSTDKSTIRNWYSGSANHVEQFMTSDSKMLLDSQVDALVSAMASFAPPPAGQITLPADYQAALNPVIAANWK